MNNEEEILEQANLNAYYDESMLKRCGYCGSYFAGNELLTAEQVEQFTPEELNEAPLGYCPNAQMEHYQQNPEDFL